MEDIFDYFELSDFQKYRLASHKFLGRAATWWEELMALWRESRHDEIKNWEIMKRLMTRHFIPHYVKDKFYLKLQRLKQGDKSCVKDYAKNFKLFIIASDVGEFERQKVVKFIRLKREIAKRLKIEVRLEPSISLKVVIELSLEHEQKVGIYEEIIIVSECKENEGVKVNELVKQQVEVKSREEEC